MAITEVQEILSNGTIGRVNTHLRIDDWEVLQSSEEALKKPKSARANKDPRTKATALLTSTLKNNNSTATTFKSKASAHKASSKEKEVPGKGYSPVRDFQTPRNCNNKSYLSYNHIRS